MHAQNFTTRILFVFMAALLSLSVCAQKKIIHGTVVDSTTNRPLKNVQVTNLATNKKTTTDDNGRFSIEVAIGDMLFFTAENYHFASLKYSILMDQTIQVRMDVLAHVLPGVTVQTAGYTKYQQDSMRRVKEFNEDLVAKPYKPVSKSHSQGFGVGINLDFLSSREKSKRKAEKLFNEHEKDAYVNYRFSTELVSNYTGLHGDTLSRFRQLYWPDYNWLRQHTSDEDLLYYINDRLKEFYKRKDMQ